MSGRAGYRKTDRKVLGRRTPAQMSPWRAAIVLPTVLGFAVSPGKTGVVGVEVGEGGLVTATGGDLEWVLKQLGEYLAAISAGQDLAMVAALERGDERSKIGRDVVITSRPSVIILPGPLHKPIIVPVRH